MLSRSPILSPGFPVPPSFFLSLSLFRPLALLPRPRVRRPHDLVVKRNPRSVEQAMAGAHVAGSPFRLLVVPGPLSANATTADGEGLAFSNAGGANGIATFVIRQGGGQESGRSSPVFQTRRGVPFGRVFGGLAWICPRWTRGDQRLSHEGSDAAEDRGLGSRADASF